MEPNEVFSNPTVERVIFEIRFPNLFGMQNIIGDLQMKIIKEFPESALIHKQQIVFTEVNEEGSFPKPPTGDEPGIRKIWQFKSPKKIQLDIQTDRLSLTSEHHKTYIEFRKVIENVMESLINILPIPILHRIGLRYIDKCPIPNMLNNAAFQEYYQTVFPLDRFDIQNTQEMYFVTVTKRDEHLLVYRESLLLNITPPSYYLDFDGSSTEVKTDDYLQTTDALHRIISESYNRTIKEPVKEYMRKPKEGNDVN